MNYTYRWLGKRVNPWHELNKAVIFQMLGVIQHSVAKGRVQPTGGDSKC